MPATHQMPHCCASMDIGLEVEQFDALQGRVAQNVRVELPRLNRVLDDCINDTYYICRPFWYSPGVANSQREVDAGKVMVIA